MWDWLTTSTLTTAATQTSAPEALQQWCPIQQKYWMELQRLLRRIQVGSNQGYRSRHERPQPELQRGFEYLQSAPGSSQTSRLPTSPHVGTANADKELGAEATTKASETKEEI